MGTPISGKPGLVGPVSNGQPVEVPVDDFGKILMAPGAPTYLEWTRRGYMYSTVTSPAAPAALPIYSTATNSPTLWNPPSSNKMVIPIRINFGMAAIATYLDNSYMLAYTPAASEVATGGTFASFTNIAPKNLLLNGPACQARYAGAAVTWTTQPTVLMNLGLSSWAAGTEANLEFAWLHYDFDGMLILPPATAISVVGVVASSSTYVVSIVFAELPLPAGM
ncbi:MAG: hypothetical protein WC683_07630 [bacterium]